MNRRKIAIGLGFAAIGLLLAEYVYLITWIVLGVPPGEGNGLTGIIAVTTGTYLLPAIVAAIFLLVGRKYPHEGGILAMWEGGLGLFIGFFLFLSRYFNIQLINLWDFS